MDTPTLMRFKDSPILTAANPGSISSNFFITPAEASFTASTSFDKNKHNVNLPTGSNNQAGDGAFNCTTWDEFPNGRFGDVKSPAFGQTNLWDSGLGVSPNDGIKRWGRPKTPSDVTSIFLAYLEGRVQTTPWSDGPLDRESAPILSHLKKLNERSWWTVGSQPAVDAAPSSHETYGWGPRGGYVFQKSFVEFFATKEEVQQLGERIEKHGRGQLTYFAANMLVSLNSLALQDRLTGYQDDYASNMAEGGSNVVTWGVFPGQEIAASTIIERDSFLAWKVRSATVLVFSSLTPLDLGRGLWILDGVVTLLPTRFAGTSKLGETPRRTMAHQYRPSRL